MEAESVAVEIRSPLAGESLKNVRNEPVIGSGFLLQLPQNCVDGLAGFRDLLVQVLLARLIDHGHKKAPPLLVGPGSVLKLG